MHIPLLYMANLLQLIDPDALIFECTLQLISASIISHTLLSHEVMDFFQLHGLLLNESSHELKARIQIIQLLHVVEVEFNA